MYQIDEETKLRLKALESHILEIKELLTKPPELRPALSDWVPEEVAMQLLRKKKTALYYLRKSGNLVATGSRPVFYSMKSIEYYLNSLKNV
jgi:hypothetical protein